MTAFDRLVRTTPVTILRAPPVEDRYGNQAPDWENADETDTTGWKWQQSSGETTIEGRDASTTIEMLALPAGADIVDTDRVRIGADVYDVNGRPDRLSTPRGEHHIEVNLKLVDG